MTMRTIRGGRAALAYAERSVIEQAAAPVVRDERDLPEPLDVLGVRFRAARIRFRVRATQTGYGLELVLQKCYAKRAATLARAKMIWLGTVGR